MRILGFKCILRCGSLHLECVMVLLDDSVASIRYCLN